MICLVIRIRKPMIRGICSSSGMGGAINTDAAAQFYARENLSRRYYYFLDCRGQLFLASTKHRNFSSSLKDKKTLELLTKSMRPINEADRRLLDNLDNPTPDFEYRFVSLCGKEKNFIATEDLKGSVCFTDLEKEVDNSTEKSVVSRRLLYGGGSLYEEFDPESLTLAKDSGRLYHPLKNHKYLTGTYGLLHPMLTQKLMSSITLNMDGQRDNEPSYDFVYDNRQYRLRSLPFLG